MVVYNFYGKVPYQFLCAGSRATRIKITKGVYLTV